MNASATAYAIPTRAWPPAARAVRPTGEHSMSRTDSLLLARLRRRDADAFDELVSQNHSAMIRVAMGYVADRDAAEEVVQDTWLAVIASIDRFEGRSSLRTWLWSIVVHKAKDRGVREKRHVNFSQFEPQDDDDGEMDPARFHLCGELAGSWALPPQPWDERTPERLLANKQASAAMSAAIEELPRGLREALLLRDVEGLESEEICAILGITEANLYVRLHRARERVRRAVEKSLEGSPLHG